MDSEKTANLLRPRREEKKYPIPTPEGKVQLKIKVALKVPQPIMDSEKTTNLLRPRRQEKKYPILTPEGKTPEATQKFPLPKRVNEKNANIVRQRRQKKKYLIPILEEKVKTVRKQMWKFWSRTAMCRRY
ncbi:uncharacterized protein LOC101862731 isoform X3 [Aplysia californica]|uniref:Uncharacterized protein LOC101862731 isoform X3 n=1 Tax=Aplysia californica TaxID=6500 RepID=A0ABM1VUC1_APLCA|nr:uncharacterized protein LOC101862731 isoform X3 [Aplysia californica]